MSIKKYLKLELLLNLKYDEQVMLALDECWLKLSMKDKKFLSARSLEFEPFHRTMGHGLYKLPDGLFKDTGA